MPETLSLNYEEIKWTYDAASSAAEEQHFSITLEGATISPVRSESQTAPADSFDFKSSEETGETAMLLPAVQAAREAARRSDDDETDVIGLTTADANESALQGDGAVIFITDSVEAGDIARDAGLRSDGDLVQSVSDADMGGDFIF